MAHLAEVAAAHPEQDRPVELRVAAHEVLLVRAERGAVLVDPLLTREVALLDEDLLGVPVLGLARQVAAPLEEQDALAGRREAMRERSAARSRADDDHVVVLAHCSLRSDEGDR